jgi:hypothetical protein
MKPGLHFAFSSLVLGIAISAVNLRAQVSVATPPSATPPDVSQLLNSLADQPAKHMGMFFDRSMLQAARNALVSEGMEPGRAAASLNSISYDVYRYGQPAMYDPKAMASIASAYRTAGWKHLVNGREKTADGVPTRGISTDLWLHYTGADIDGVTVLTRGTKDVNLVQIACDLRPIDLLHLGGHFGIPKVDPNAVMIPAPDEH